MAPQVAAPEPRVAVLVDCDNVATEVLEHALRAVAQSGRNVLRRGYPQAIGLASPSYTRGAGSLSAGPIPEQIHQS